MKGETWFTADTHFHHKFLADLRGFGDVNVMNEFIIEAWNAVVTPRDEVWHLGDFSFGPLVDQELTFKRLNGRKHLVKGNHDKPGALEFGWASVSDFKRVSYRGKTLYLFHYPMLTWPNAHHGSYHLHGHSHGNLQAPSSTRMDVGIDATGLVVTHAQNVLDALFEREYDFIDHHTHNSYDALRSAGPSETSPEGA